MSETASPTANLAAKADERLVRAIASGSAEALAELYDRYAATVFGLARRITARQEDAEEVVQDVFAQVWRQAGRYQDGRATVVAWLVMLTRTRAIDRLRARTARPDQHAPAPIDDVPGVATQDPSPEQVTLSSEEAKSVRQALTVLPDSQRALVDLAYFEGLTHSEIATRTAIPLGTVKTRLRAALFTLRDSIGRMPRSS